MLNIFICIQFLVGLYAGFLHSKSPNTASPADLPTAYVFLGTDCPISQDYVGVLNNLKTEYGNRVHFEGVIPQPANSNDIELFRREYQVQFELRPDSRPSLVHKFGVSRTPEVVLVNATGNLQYQGAIDDWYYDLGKHRPQPTAHYLKDAIDACLQGKPANPRRTDAVGCILQGGGHH